VPKLDDLKPGDLKSGPGCGPGGGAGCQHQGDGIVTLSRLVALNGLGASGGVKPPEDLPQPKPVPDEKKDDKKDAANPMGLPATMLNLEPSNWSDGQAWTDDKGRRWTLLKGCPLTEKVTRMRGWLLESDGKKMYFLHESGALFLRTATP